MGSCNVVKVLNDIGIVGVDGKGCVECRIGLPCTFKYDEELEQWTCSTGKLGAEARKIERSMHDEEEYSLPLYTKGGTALKPYAMLSSQGKRNRRKRILSLRSSVQCVTPPIPESVGVIEAVCITPTK